jgi:c(7)-type cytochrome triheme protein
MRMNTPTRGGQHRIRRLEAIVLMLGCGVLAYAIMAAPKTTWAGEPGVRPPTGDTSTNTEFGDPPQDTDYSKFQHGTSAHARLDCLLCHRRDDNSGRISFPGGSGHMPCAGCHTQQFQDNTSPICTICHTTTGMKRFPGLKSFSANFDHARHLRVNCSVCHKSASKGAALSIPTGASAHNTCFQCHTASSPSKMSSCSTCHVPGRPNWTSEWAKSFRISFSHTRHAGRGGLNCATCHVIKAGQPRGRQVTEPLASMHFAPANSLSCGGCHNGKKAFGADDFTNCKRCHQSNTFKF